jgi:hypothetical protein
MDSRLRGNDAVFSGDPNVIPAQAEIHVKTTEKFKKFTYNHLFMKYHIFTIFHKYNLFLLPYTTFIIQPQPLCSILISIVITGIYNAEYTTHFHIGIILGIDNR